MASHRSPAVRRRRLLARPVGVVALALVALAGTLGAGRSPAAAGAQARPASTGPVVLPARVFDPYFEAWSSERLATVASESGAKDLTLAFLQTPRRGSCRLDWNGVAAQSVASGAFRAQIAAVRALGGDVFPSFGGYSADLDGTDIADSCPSVAAVARAYEQVVTVYDARVIDLDVESNALGDIAGIKRRNAAVRELENWAAARHRPLEVQYTLGVSAAGLDRRGLYVLQSARNHHALVTVNLMAFDYYDGTTRMAAAAIDAAEAVHRQLAAVFLAESSAERWAAESLTLMIGYDDNPDRRELTSLADTSRIEAFARAHGLHAVSFWAIQRDNGGCPGTVGSDTCSGIAQAPWAFSRLLDRYTS